MIHLADKEEFWWIPGEMIQLGMDLSRPCLCNSFELPGLFSKLQETLCLQLWNFSLFTNVWPQHRNRTSAGFHLLQSASVSFSYSGTDAFLVCCRKSQTPLEGIASLPFSSAAMCSNLLFSPLRKIIWRWLCRCGASFLIEIVSSQFEGKRLLERHRMVNAALEEEMKQIHALSIRKALTPEQWKQQQESENPKPAAV